MSGYPEDALQEVDGFQIETDFVSKPFTSAVLAARVAAKLRSSADAMVESSPPHRGALPGGPTGVSRASGYPAVAE
jgi:DNA-binding response OmpR family regulator